MIPLKSDSDEVILADLGKLKLSNSFFLVPQDKTAIAEAYDIKLSDLQVSRCLLNLCCLFVPVCVCMYVYVCMYVCMFICMYVCMYDCMYVCTVDPQFFIVI